MGTSAVSPSAVHDPRIDVYRQISSRLILETPHFVGFEICHVGRVLAEFDDPDMKSLVVQLDESCATKARADRERWLADLLDTHRRRSEEALHRSRLAAARQDTNEAEQLLASFCEQSKSKHLSEYERRKK